MQQLLQKLQTIKAEKLAAFKQELAEQETQALHELTTKVTQLRAEIERVKQATASQQASKGAFEAEITTRFALEAYKLELLRLFWADISKQHFSKKETVNAWITNQLEAVLAGLQQDESNEVSGTIEAGASYDFLKKSKLPKGLELVKSDASSQFGEDHGFVVTTATKIIDARLSTYLDELFSRNQADLYKVAFI